MVDVLIGGKVVVVVVEVGGGVVVGIGPSVTGGVVVGIGVVVGRVDDELSALADRV